MNSLTLSTNYSLKNHNTFGISAQAKYFVQVHSLEQLSHLLNDPRYRELVKLTLGEGSNVLFTQDFAGVVIQNCLSGKEILQENAKHVWLKFGAGENWHNLVMYCIERNYAGIENLSLIPGTMGAAPMQNIGAYGVELKDCFFELEAINIADGQLYRFAHHECEFGYRDSVFKNQYKNQFIITAVTLRLNKYPTFHTQYGAIMETLDAMQVKEINIRSISQAVMTIRRCKLPDPAQIGNAGSFFKNPVVAHEHFARIQGDYPQIPHYLLADNQIKIPAAWLIEQCGWKGKRVGQAGVHAKQALVLVNYGQAQGRDIVQLSQAIQQSVMDKFSIFLNPEVNII